MNAQVLELVLYLLGGREGLPF